MAVPTHGDRRRAPACGRRTRTLRPGIHRLSTTSSDMPWTTSAAVARSCRISSSPIAIIAQQTPTASSSVSSDCLIRRQMTPAKMMSDAPTSRSTIVPTHSSSCIGAAQRHQDVNGTEQHNETGEHVVHAIHRPASRDGQRRDREGERDELPRQITEARRCTEARTATRRSRACAATPRPRVNCDATAAIAQMAPRHMQLRREVDARGAIHAASSATTVGNAIM